MPDMAGGLLEHLHQTNQRRVTARGAERRRGGYQAGGAATSPNGSIGKMSDRAQRDAFDQSAAVYHSSRPAYPTALFDDLLSISRLTAPAHVLEIGAGPGTATVDMAQLGFRIDALELGPDLAEQARINLAAFPAVRSSTAASKSGIQ